MLRHKIAVEPCQPGKRGLLGLHSRVGAGRTLEPGGEKSERGIHFGDGAKNGGHRRDIDIGVIVGRRMRPEIVDRVVGRLRCAAFGRLKRAACPWHGTPGRHSLILNDERINADVGIKCRVVGRQWIRQATEQKAVFFFRHVRQI